MRELTTRLGTPGSSLVMGPLGPVSAIGVLHLHGPRRVTSAFDRLGEHHTIVITLDESVS